MRLRVRDNEHGGKRKVVTMDGACFVERFLQHVLPTGYKRIRHYGLLAPAAKTQRLQAARAALAMPQPNPRAAEDARRSCAGWRASRSSAARTARPRGCESWR